MAVLMVLNHKPVSPPLCQAGIGVAIHWLVGSGSTDRTSPGSYPSPPFQLNNLLKQNI